MATSRDDTKLTFRKFEDGDHKWDNWSHAIFEGDHSHKCPTYVHRTPPCQGSCPSGEDIRGWLDIVRGIERPPEGVSMQEYAFLRSTDANPFPAMMGRVCPAPCQDGCNRNEVEDFVGINAVEQYIGDAAFQGNFSFRPGAPLIGKKVAIIGGGPAGMAAAYQLRRRGIASTIFDDHEQLGGMMRYGIPNYRIPRDELDYECRRILDLGDIDFKGNTRIGRDVSVAELEKNYDAILWALGCWTGRGLPLEGWDETPNCVSAVKFLEQFNKGNLKYTANRVVCVGGGDTSIDVVSVSRRIGTLIDLKEKPEDVVNGLTNHGDIDASLKKPCDSVTLTALFPRNQMTAAEHEVNDAVTEGVHLLNEVMPVEIIRNAEGRATALRLVESKWENNGPVAVEGGKEYVIECDMIVAAIGQGGEMSGLEEYANDRNLVDSDKFYQVPNRPGHFVAGDIVRPHLLTTAIGQGSIAAESIEHYLKQEEQRKRPKVDKHHFSLLDKMKEAGLEPTPYAEGETRGTNFEKFAVHNYEDRSRNEVITAEKLFLGHFKFTPRLLREEGLQRRASGRRSRTLHELRYVFRV
jgi:NADPH-dependent glutamate synthase beta subunit-like oxidoreductase